MSICLALLAYKEAENLEILLPQIHSELKGTGEEYEILVIDTQIPLDNTNEICKIYNAKYINQEEPCFGGAFRTAIKHAAYDKFLIMDSDGSHKPEYILPIYERFIAGADIVIGSRYVKGGETKDSKLSIIMSKTLNAVYRLCLGIRAKDISTDFRMYHTNQLKKVELINNNYDILQEVLLKLKTNKPELDIQEVPIIFDKRIHGESKRRLLPFIISYLKTLFQLMNIRLQHCRHYNVIKQTFLYCVIGGIAAIFDFGMFTIINIIYNYKHPEVANLISALFGFSISFTLNTRYNFKKADKLFKRFVSYFIICIIGTMISTCIMHLLKATINLMLLKINLIALIAMIQFLLNKLITFRD